MSTVVVFIAEQDNPEQGTLKRFESAELAERFVESQLESDVAVESLKVFKVAEIPLAVSYRPVVSLSAQQASTGDAPAEEAAEAKPYEKDGQRLSSVLPRDEI
jgi:hypothetical protein